MDNAKYLWFDKISIQRHPSCLFYFSNCAIFNNYFIGSNCHNQIVRDEFEEYRGESIVWSQSIVPLPSLLTRRVNYLDWICSIILPTQEREAQRQTPFQLHMETSGFCLRFIIWQPSWNLARSSEIWKITRLRSNP